MLCCAEFRLGQCRDTGLFRMLIRDRLVTCADIRSSNLVLGRCQVLHLRVDNVTADCNRLMPAPMVPRIPATLAMAVFDVGQAVTALPEDVRLSVAKPLSTRCS